VDWLLFVLAVAVIAVVGIGIGLFVAPRLTRWSDRAADGGGSEASEGDAGESPDGGARNGDHVPNDDGAQGGDGDGDGGGDDG